MTARVILIVLSIAAVLAIAALAWTSQGEHRCQAALSEAEALFSGGDPLGALRALDAADARYHCGRLTQGDAPPEYSLAVACIRRLKAMGREAELNALLKEARGPILTDLARKLSSIAPEGA